MEKPLILGNNKCLKGISSIHQFLPLMGYQNLARTFLCAEMKILQQMLGMDPQGTTEPGSAGLGAAWKVLGVSSVHITPSQHTAGQPELGD